jgi:hypothetical protein
MDKEDCASLKIIINSYTNTLKAYLRIQAGKKEFTAFAMDKSRFRTSDFNST